jgi:pimeloyl-ACP methyl ester carboxylesterase
MDPEQVVVTRQGEGPEVLLVHGGASAQTTWGALRPLQERWTLALLHRRGYPPSPPPPGGRQDWELDAADVALALGSRVHLAAHSYGVVAALLAAVQAPARVRSLTLIEPPIYHLLPGDADVERLEGIGNEVLEKGLAADPATLREFLRVAGAPELGDGPLPEEVARGVRRAHGGRPPGEARPALGLLREAGIPSLVASGGHSDALERICDALAQTLGAERVVAPGAGHFVADAPGFASEFERFLRSVP